MWRTGFRQCVGHRSAIHVPVRSQCGYDADNQSDLGMHHAPANIGHRSGDGVRNMANNEVPRAIRSEASNRIDNDGTRMAPPPTPSRPARMPAITPNTTINRPVTRFNSIEESREGTNMSWLRMTNAMNTTNAQRSTTSDNRDSSSEPICRRQTYR